MDMCEVFKALGDETRLRIMALLAQQELCVCVICEALRIPQPTASKHLNRLRVAGLIRCRRLSQWCFYRVSDTFAVSPLFGCLTKLWEETRQYNGDITRLQALLNSNMCREQQLHQDRHS
jgi:ArsR family transcriptional regulator